MERDNALDDNARHACSITADSIIGSGGGASTCVPSIARMNPSADLLGIPTGKMRAILFAISIVTIVLAFYSGPSFIGMFFAVVSIASFGYGLGSLMNSPPP